MRRTTIALATPLVGLTLGLTLALAACTSSDDAAEPTTEPSPTADAGAVAEEAKQSKSAGEPEPADEPIGSGAACLVGSWVVDAESVKSAALASATLTSAGAEFDATVTVTGDAFLTFTADGSAVTEYADQVVDMTAAVQGADLRSYGRTDGPLVTSYTATETEVTTFDGDASDIRMELTTTINGEPFDVGDMAALTLATWEAGSTMSYVCAGDTLELRPAIDMGFDTSGFVSLYHRR